MTKLFKLYPLKTSILLSLFVLMVGEWVDGHLDHSDIVTPVLFTLFIYNVFILHHTEDLFNFSSRTNADNKKIIFNLIIVFLFVGSIVIDSVSLPISFQLSLYKLGLTLWAGVFTANSMLQHRKARKLSSLIFSQFAFLTLAVMIMQL